MAAAGGCSCRTRGPGAGAGRRARSVKNGKGGGWWCVRAPAVAAATVAVVAVALAYAPAAASAGGHSAVRTLDRASADPGGEVEVTIEARGFGPFARVSEALPAGWTYSGSSLPEEVVRVEAGTARFLLLNTDGSESVSFTYTVTAPAVVGTYAFSGIIEDADRVEGIVGGDSEVVVRPTGGCLRGSSDADPSVAPSRGARFCDVAADVYYAAPVAQLHSGGVLGGTLCSDGLCPSEPVDRKTLAVWVVRLLDGQDPQPVTRSEFDDVDPEGFHARFIERLAELGVTRGCGDGSGFCPQGSVSRAQMAVFLSRAYDLPDSPAPGFTDVPDDAWYAAEVAKLAASGITMGCGDGTRFCPELDTTRGQMVTFLHRAEKQKEEASAG